MTKGSEWRIWDLHVHTPFSALSSGFGDPNLEATWDTYVGKLEEKASEKAIAVLGITDYFTIDGYKRLREFQRSGRLQNILLIPNIEFRCDQVIYRDKDNSEPKRLNYHVLLSPAVSPADIEDQFLHNLDFVFENSPFEASTRRRLKVTSLTEFGGQLRSQHGPFKESFLTDFQLGCQNAVVRIGDIQDVLYSSSLRGQYLLVLAEEDLSVMNWNSQHHAVRKQLIQMSHAVFSSNKQSRDFYLGKKAESPDKFVAEFKSLKPCIWGSDTHSYEQRFLEPEAQRYCWIKAEPTWLGLKQILAEPEERVRVQLGTPESPKSIYILAHVDIGETAVAPELRLAQFGSPVNPNLVAIVGGRGSGKTALLDIIASGFLEGRSLADQKGSFIQRIYKPDNGADKIPTSIRFLSGETHQFQVGGDGIFGKSDIVYLTQDHFDEYTGDNAKLFRHIEDLIYSRLPDDLPAHRRYDDDMNAMKQEILQLNLDIQELRKAVQGKRELEVQNRKSQEGIAHDFELRLEQLRVEQENEVESTRRITEELALARRRAADVEALRFKLSEMASRLVNAESNYVEQSASANALILAIFSTNTSNTLPDRIDGIAAIKDKLRSLGLALVDLQAESSNSISVLNSKVGELQGISKSLAELQQKRDQALAEITAIDAHLAAIETDETRLTDMEQKRRLAFTRLLWTVRLQRNNFQETIGKFSLGKDELLNGIDFKASIAKDHENEYFNFIYERLDGRKHSLSEIGQGLRQIISEVHAICADSTIESSDIPPRQLVELVHQLEKTAFAFVRRSRVSESDFANAIFAKFIKIDLDVFYEEKMLTNLSMGERAVVLLKIVLSMDDRPLLIDQPENHLDNRFVYSELTPAFRRAKAMRQIIIASHNANLVVNTDAEQIIVAENVDGTISYRTGTIEDPTMRSRLETILEGGREAFIKREEKYGHKY